MAHICRNCVDSDGQVVDNTTADQTEQEGVVVWNVRALMPSHTGSHVGSKNISVGTK